MALSYTAITYEKLNQFSLSIFVLLTNAAFYKEFNEFWIFRKQN